MKIAFAGGQKAIEGDKRMRNKTHLMSVAICAAIVLLGSDYAMAGTWTPLDAPGTGVYQTSVSGISGNNVVGYYSHQDSSPSHSFLYNGGSWTELPISPSCIDGSIVVSMSGERYNLTTGILTPASVQFTGSQSNRIYGISGSYVVGEGPYGNDGLEHGFLWNFSTQTYTLLNYPGAGPGETYAEGISGDSVVGWYRGSFGPVHGYLYNITTQSYTSFHYPGATGETIAQGISGNNIVGQYWDNSGEHGFLYNGTSWTTLSYPGAVNTYAYGISGNNIVGNYNYGDGMPVHGFIYTIPEPATLLLFGLGAVMLRKKYKKSLRFLRALRSPR
jgi:hypothetical protein